MKKKILVIDDEEYLLELTQRLLRSSGYEVINLANGTNALNLIKKELPHLVLMDLLMPDKDGGEICQEMKSDAAIHHIPVILTTGQMLDQSEYSDKESIGADDYLMKPFEIDDLLAKIENLLAK